jgi:RING-type zinc-finger
MQVKGHYIATTSPVTTSAGSPIYTSCALFLPMQAERKLSKFGCQLCKVTMDEPVCTPCGHFFCKPCLAAKYAAQDAAAAASTARMFRTRKVPKPCPKCNANLHDFVAQLQVNQAVAAEIAQCRTALQEASSSFQDAQQRIRGAYTELTDASAAPQCAAEVSGWRVAVFWPDEQQWFEGHASAADAADTVTVTYDDGDVQEHRFGEEQFKWFVAAGAAADCAGTAVDRDGAGARWWYPASPMNRYTTMISVSKAGAPQRKHDVFVHYSAVQIAPWPLLCHSDSSRRLGRALNLPAC